MAGAGIDRKDIKTTDVTLQPQYSNPEPNGTAAITGYRAANAIEVRMHPPDAASRTLALIVGTVATPPASARSATPSPTTRSW